MLGVDAGGEADDTADMIGGERTRYIRSHIREIPDFPQPGILFRDITPLLARADGMQVVTDGFIEALAAATVHFDAVVGIEARGFIFGAALASKMGKSFVPVRKPGKLPADVDRVSYSLEYGQNVLEMHRHSLPSGARVLVVDDLLATGGTALAAAQLAQLQGAVVVGYAFVIELLALGGRARLTAPIVSQLSYE